MRPVVLFSLIIQCVTVQLWLVLIALSRLIPQANTLSTVVWPEWQYAVRPERDALLFHFYVFGALAAQAIGIWSVRRKLDRPSFIKEIVPFLAAELIWTTLMLNAGFKIVVYPNSPWLAETVFIFLAVGALISKVFWPEITGWSFPFFRKVLSASFDVKADLLVVIGLILLLFIPDSKAVLARMFFGDQSHHFDSFLAPTWAYSKGCVLNVDIMTEYGVGIPVMASWITRIIGGVSYTHVFWFWMGGTILYFILCFLFLRRWLKSFGLALAAVLLAIKFQMFHSGVTPIVFTFPSATVMRYFWDIIVFLLLWEHLCTLRWYYLAGAAICSGVSIFYMTTTGYCLAIALGAYVTAFMIMGHLRRSVCKKNSDAVGFCSVLLLVPLTTGLLLQLTEGPHLWTAEFWQNMQEFNKYFLSGFGLMPMYETMQHKEALAGLMGFFIPVVYMGTFLVLSGLLYFQKTKDQDLMAAVISLYGMMMYHYYVARSAPTSYYVVCIPYVFILCFWARRGLQLLQETQRRSVILGLLALVVYALLTNHTFLAYPNLFCLSRNPMVDPHVVQPLSDGRSYFNQLFSQVPENQKLAKNSLGETDEGLKYEKDFKTDVQLEKYYDQESNFSRDADLIASMTNPSDAVAVLSSFEIRMLMQADRKPFFYYSPILVARPMRMRIFPNSAMYTLGHAARTIRQLQNAKPRYIFMEKIFLQAPGVENFKDASLAALLNYIFINYEPDVQGQYLVAMKLKE